MAGLLDLKSLLLPESSKGATVTKNQRFRLSKSTLGVRLEGGKPTGTTIIPADSVITIISGLANPQGTIEVDWQGLRALLFIRDIEERGKLVGLFPDKA